MASVTYDANLNIIQTITAKAVGFNEGDGVVVSPLTNAAINGFGDATGAPNTYGTVGRDLSPKTTSISFASTNGSGQVTSVLLNPA